MIIRLIASSPTGVTKATVVKSVFQPGTVSASPQLHRRREAHRRGEHALG